jgi:excinuclease ABC subunit C
MREFNIKEELKKLPASPGVYLMHNAKDDIIYVGKAVILKNRVRQYFQSSRRQSAKIIQMVSHIAWFEYIVTDSELEALVLESNLIKKYQPRYNTMLKDDKNYPYIRVTVQEDYPQILLARECKKDKAKYFGPYTSAESVRETIQLLHKLFQIRDCKQVLHEGVPAANRACLNYHMKQCYAPCQGCISKEDYAKSIEQALDFLCGRNYRQVEDSLTGQMQQASENLDFETAAKYRDLLMHVKKIEEHQKITDQDMENRDILAVAMDESQAVVQIFFVRNGRLNGRDHFYLQVNAEETPSDILNAFVKQFYNGTPTLPREILLQCEIPDQSLVEAWLSQKKGKKVTLKVPQKGEKARLVELAHKNAQLIFSQNQEKIRREKLRTVGAVKQLSDLLGLEAVHRMEAYDISNTSGFQSVGSMVVFENGKAKRNDYRKFKIKSVTGPNDYASMEEVLTRRFLHGLEEKEQERHSGMENFSHFPDLILMDGGRGQVNIALEVLAKLNLQIPVCGMVKDDHHRTRGLYYNNVEIPIDTHSEAFHLITRIQDEAHRFAIEYHRSLRKQAQVHSILDDIQGIGPARRKALMKQYRSLDEIRRASVEELASLPQMNQSSAENVYRFFHTN